jgi:hypothetical protein
MTYHAELSAAWPAEWPAIEPAELYTVELSANPHVRVRIHTPGPLTAWRGCVDGLSWHECATADDLVWALQRDIAVLAARLSALSGPDLRLVAPEGEGTRAPWWYIWTPAFHHTPSQCIAGPFYSRESAERHLANHRHRFTAKSYVWCASGWQSRALDHAYNATHEVKP